MKTVKGNDEQVQIAILEKQLYFLTGQLHSTAWRISGCFFAVYFVAKTDYEKIF